MRAALPSSEMSAATIEVSAPCRLHFGLASFGQPTARQYGGAGVMVARPRLRLRISQAARFEAAGPAANRVSDVVDRMRRVFLLREPPACRVEVLEMPPEHAGLGTGTQLALAVVEAINTFRGGQRLTPFELAALGGRGLRSAIGTYGFVQGGLLAEPGKFDHEVLAPLQFRVELPEAWRFVLVEPASLAGLWGDEERQAFAELPPVTRSTTAALLTEISDEMIPAARAGEFERFSESVYRYGYQAGMLFAARQGGAFASPRIAELVAAMREAGVRGVGQSSWGLTVFAILQSQAAADDFAQQFRTRLAPQDVVIITELDPRGAQVSIR